MKIAVLTFEGFNELDSLIVVHYVAPVEQKDDWVARARAVLDPFL